MARLPAARIDVVELDPEVVDVAYEYFDVPRDPRLRIDVEDGRRFLADNEGPWDAIVIDAFYSDSIPFHLATREFLELARSRLTPGGTVSTNIIGAVRGTDSRLFRSMLRTHTAPSSRRSRSIRCGAKVRPASRGSVTSSSSRVALRASKFLLERWAELGNGLPAPRP